MSNDPTNPATRPPAPDSPEPDRVDRYNELVADEAARLTATIAGIRDDEAAGHLTTREAADNRIAVLEAHLTRLRLLRAEYLGTE